MFNHVIALKTSWRLWERLYLRLRICGSSVYIQICFYLFIISSFSLFSCSSKYSAYLIAISFSSLTFDLPYYCICTAFFDISLQIKLFCAYRVLRYYLQRTNLLSAESVQDSIRMFNTKPGTIPTEIHF